MSGGGAGNRDYRRSAMMGQSSTNLFERSAPPGIDSAEPVILQFLAQGGAMDPEHRRRAALVAVAMLQYFREQRDLEFAQRDFVQIGCVGTVEIADIAANGIRDMIAQRCARGGAGGRFMTFGVQARSLR